MWVLECDGNLLQNKRLWLKPGTKFLLGRNKPPDAPGQHAYVIENKSVSRKHLIIAVDPVRPGTGSSLHTRSTITISDDSKIGTTLDGERFSKESRVLTKDDHEIKLGSYEQVFRIKWHPAVLTFSFTSKEQKASQDPLASIRARLEPLDIKTTTEYVVGQTTHAVSNKRNTAKGLQALINGKYIVTDGFVDAVEAAATSAINTDDPDSPLPSPLEADFDQNWPDALQYLPPVGKEPKPRPAELFRPNPDRLEVFAGYTFVFCDELQFENLHAPITNGGGKALQYEIVMGQTTVAEFVRYVKGIAGEKGLGEFGDDSAGKGVVVVRFRGKKGFEDWSINFIQQVDLQLDQRSIEQNEFLDAILLNDASGLRKRLEEEMDLDSSSQAQPATADSASSHVINRRTSITEASSSSALPRSTEPTPARRRARRAITQSRFKFDDFDSSQLPKTQPKSQYDTLVEDVDEVDSQSNQASAVRNADDFPDSIPISGGTQTQRSVTQSRKRRDPPSEDSLDEDDAIDGLLPAAAAMKRRRLEREQRDPNTSVSGGKSQQKENDAPVAPTHKAKKKREEINVLELACSRREAEEEAARQGAESLRTAMEGMDIEAMKNLAKVEEMEVLPRANRPPQREDSEARSARWDERWNGRKNFKRFRRKGESAGLAPRKVIVGLEEVKKKDFGIGEEYWLESGSGSRGRPSQSQSQAQALPQLQSQARSSANATQSRNRETGEEDTTFKPRRSRVVPDDKEEDVKDPGAVVTQEDVEPTQETGVQGKAGRNPRKEQSQTQRGKRPAAAPPSAVRQPPAKRTRGATARREEESEEEDGMRFRFRRKG